ncbi:hypothetical protein Syun_030364 [Stephania yunnanensis]|uniref:BHLH domain-containing protein n=1 Tax=Stephania yunnanensis TaxID=152371 RepID=A0AAP0E757_9MAGN
MFMDERKFAFNGDEMAVQFSQLSCSSSGQQTDHHNWENNLMGESHVSETRPIVSSLATRNAVVSTDGIVVEDQFSAETKLGGICNSTNIIQQSQILMGRSKSFNMVSSYNASPIKFKDLLMDQQVSNNLPDAGKLIQCFPNSETITNDYAALNERTMRLLSSGSRSFCGRRMDFEFNENEGGSRKQRTRVSDNRVFNAAESLTCSKDDSEGSASALGFKFSQLLTSSAHEIEEFTNAGQQEDSRKIYGTDIGMINPNGGNSRKRKEIAKGDAKEDDDPLILQTCLPSQIIGDESNAVNSNENKIVERQTNSQSRRSEPPKDYIHVRARRGQATDSHSLAERVRREKISKRMKLLQDLVPGCRKVTGKAVMLDEIINYVQSLQRQVQFLSMKLATVNPILDFDTGPPPPENIFHMVSPSDSSVLAMEQESAMERSFSNGMENQTSKDHPFDNHSQVQTVRDGDLQSLVQKHLGQLQIQELEFPCQSSHGSSPT